MFVVASLGVRRMSPAKITASPRCLEMRRAHVFGPGSLVCTQPVVRARCHRGKACRDTPARHTLLALMVSSSASAPWSLGACSSATWARRTRRGEAPSTLAGTGGSNCSVPRRAGSAPPGPEPNGRGNMPDRSGIVLPHGVFFTATVRLRVRALVRGLCGVGTGVRRRCRDRPRGRSCFRDRRPGNRARS